MVQKKPLVLLHGALGAGSVFKPVLPLLEAEFMVFTPDFEGHGKSPARERPFRIENFSENLHEYLTAHRIKEAGIFGYSMGGYIALYYMSQGSTRVSRLFTLGTKFQWDGMIAKKESSRLDVEKITRKVPQFASLLERRHIENSWEEVVGKTVDMMHDLGRTNIIQEINLSHVKQPVRIAIGDKDDMVTQEESVEMYRKLPNAEFQVMNDTPHPIERVDPERLAQNIREFFMPAG